MWHVVWFCFGLAVINASKTDDVLLKMDAGPRFQYMVGPDGTHLVDLWLKTSDVAAAARYNPSTDNVYHLFTRSNPTVSQPLLLGSTSLLAASNFDPTKKTVVLAHGWLNTPTSDFNVHITHAYVASEDVNLIMTDWSIGAAGEYLVALQNAIRSGEHVASFINWLNQSTGASLDNYHIIGHSLGGHQAGIIGRYLGGVVPYITSLDPALPGWTQNEQAFKSTDGIYTEVMHTDAGYYGLVSPAGDVDFYPNGGSGMPGCSDSSCDHHQCVFYMAESIRTGGFTGQQCETLDDALTGSCTLATTLRMGGVNPKTGSTGMFYVPTNAYTPYSQG